MLHRFRLTDRHWHTQRPGELPAGTSKLAASDWYDHARQLSLPGRSPRLPVRTADEGRKEVRQEGRKVRGQESREEGYAVVRQVLVLDVGPGWGRSWWRLTIAYVRRDVCIMYRGR